MPRGPDKQFDTEVALRSAMEVFWQRGYEGAGMRELLERMGIARKSLYDTFGSKRELFLRALRLYSDSELAAVRQTLDRDGSALDNLREVLNGWQDACGAEERRGCLLGNNIAHFSGDDVEMMSLLRLHLESLERAFARAIEKAQRDGEIGTDADPADLARMLVATAQGLALMARVRDDDGFAESVVRRTLAALQPS